MISSVSLDDELTVEPRELLDRLETIVVAIDDETDVDGYYRGYFAEQNVTALLYRPDFYIFGSATGMPDVTQLVAGLSDQLLVRPLAGIEH